MSEISKQTVPYFPHRCLSSTTVDTYIEEYGSDGYMFWFRLLEKLATTNGHFIDASNKYKWKALVKYVGSNDADKVCSMIELGIDLGKLDRELWETYRIIWYQGFVDNLAEAYRRRKASLPTRETVLQYAVNMSSTCRQYDVNMTSTCRQPTGNCRVDEMRVDEMRRDEMRVESAKKPQKKKTKKAEPFRPPTLEDLTAYIQENNYKVNAQKFLAHYEANGWTRGKNAAPIKDWKACVRYWNATEDDANGKTKPRADNAQRDYDSQTSGWD